MGGIREPEPPAQPRDLVAGIARHPEPRLANAVHAEALLGDVDHRVAGGFLLKSAPIFVAGKEKEMTLVEHAPPGIAGYRLASIKLGDRTRSVIRRLEAL